MSTEPLDPQRIVPASKVDDDAVENLRRADKAAVLAQAGPLLEWLQDGNWPVSGGVAEVLRPYTNDIKDELLAILRSNDGDWKYWCIVSLIDMAPVSRLDDELLAELRRIADLTDYNEWNPEPVEEARAAWEEWTAQHAALPPE